MAPTRQAKTSKRGFAAMDQVKQRQIASKGGQSVPSEKRSFSKDPELAAEAGRKGGQSVSPQARSFSQNRNLAAKAELGEQAEPKWNFHKLLVGKDGQLVHGFGSRTEPGDPALKAAIDQAL